MPFDFAVLDWVQSQLRSDFLDAAMPVVTRLGDGGILWLLCAAVLLFIPKTRRSGAAVLAALGLEVLCCNLILKPLVARPRPFAVNTAVELLIARPADNSFPSGHTGASFAAVSALYFSKNRLWIPACALSVLIGFSRIYLYVHYLSDVLAGVLVGILSGWLGYKLQKYAGTKISGQRA